MSNVVSIQISGLPAIYPQGYVEKLNTYLRVVAYGTHSEVVVTDDAFRTVGDPNYQERMVQATTYDKYLLRIPADEHLRAERLQFAKFGTVVTQDEVSHKMKVLNVNYTREEGTELGMFEIEYADINPKNYKNQQLPINNYLETNQVQQDYTTDQLVGLTYSITEIGTIPRTVYTELLPEDEITEPQEETNDVTGIEKVTRSLIQRQMKVRFYMTADDKNLFMRYIPWADSVTLSTPSGSYTSLERILPEVKPVGVNLFQIDLAVKYESSIFYPENK